MTQWVVICYYLWELSYSLTQHDVPSSPVKLPSQPRNHVKGQGCWMNVRIRHFSKDSWFPFSGYWCIEAKSGCYVCSLLLGCHYFSLLPIQHHRSHFNFLPFHMCDSLLKQWKAWLWFSLVDIFIWSNSLYITNLPSLLPPAFLQVPFPSCWDSEHISQPLPHMDVFILLGFWNPT